MTSKSLELIYSMAWLLNLLGLKSEVEAPELVPANTALHSQSVKMILKLLF